MTNMNQKSSPLLSPNYTIAICSEPLDLAALNGRIQKGVGEHGASVIFTGSVRASDEEKGLVAMTLEHYPGMTESTLQSIIEQAITRWGLVNVVVNHRVGRLTAGEPIVFVGASALHRLAAFEGAQYIMDYLKNKATFWKKEHYIVYGKETSHWVAEKKSDEQSLSRWSE
jgi:molybdopterin synthase catalytic subunit